MEARRIFKIYPSISKELFLKLVPIKEACGINLYPESFKEILANTSYPACIALEEKDQILGFLSILEISKEEVQIYPMVDPNYQRQGIGTSLIAKALEELKKENPNLRLLLPVDDTNALGLSFAESLSYQKKDRELAMNLRAKKRKLKKNYHFHIPPKIKITRVDGRNLKARLYLGGRLLGGCQFTYSNEDLKGFVCISHVLIKKEERNRGYAFYLLSKSMAFLANRNKDCQFILHLKESNGPAKKLYENLGFTSLESISYYEL